MLWMLRTSTGRSRRGSLRNSRAERRALHWRRRRATSGLKTIISGTQCPNNQSVPTMSSISMPMMTYMSSISMPMRI